jgi:hypothetical protein
MRNGWKQCLPSVGISVVSEMDKPHQWLTVNAIVTPTSGVSTYRRELLARLLRAGLTDLTIGNIFKQRGKRRPNLFARYRYRLNVRQSYTSCGALRHQVQGS